MNDETSNNASTVVAVHGETLPRGGYRFTAELADGTRAVVRAKATRPYRFAFQFHGPVATGKSGLAADFAYSANAQPPRMYVPHRATFAIVWPAGHPDQGGK